jgi:protein phosphatase
MCFGFFCLGRWLFVLEIACIVKTGARPVNDDRAAINGIFVEQGFRYVENLEGACLAVVCDGVGGEPYGDKAAEVVAGHFARIFGENLTAETIEAHVAKANDEVIAAQRADRECSGMKTTVAGLYLNKDDAIVFYVGDSRVYRFRSYLYQMSTDHTLKQEQIESGISPKPGAENFLSRCIGSENAAPEIVSYVGKVFENDVYILCTDGIWGVLSDVDFENLLSREMRVCEAAESIMELAIKNGSQDNLSIVLIRIVPEL